MPLNKPVGNYGKVLILGAVFLSLIYSATLSFALPADEDGTNELMRAIRDGLNDRIDALIEDEEYVNARDAYGWSPLMYAIFRRDADLVEKLLLNGAKINIQDQEGNTPLIMVIGTAQLPQLPPTSLEGMNYKYEFALVVGMKLLELGADPNQANELGKTPLSLALLLGVRAEGLVDELLSRGADPNSADIEGTTPLMVTVGLTTNPRVIEKLLEAGADPNQADKRGRTPLYFLKNPDTRYTEWAPLKAISTCTDPMKIAGSGTTSFDTEGFLQMTGMREQPLIDLLVNSGAVNSLDHPEPATQVLYSQPQLDGFQSLSLQMSQFNYSNARNNGILEGSFMVYVLVDAEGKVKDARVMVGLPNQGSRELVRAARNLRFIPGMRNGQNTECWAVRSSGFSITLETEPYKKIQLPESKGDGPRFIIGQ